MVIGSALDESTTLVLEKNNPLSFKVLNIMINR